jgi:hypothetical protein
MLVHLVTCILAMLFISLPAGRACIEVSLLVLLTCACVPLPVCWFVCFQDEQGRRRQAERDFLELMSSIEGGGGGGGAAHGALQQQGGQVATQRLNELQVGVQHDMSNTVPRVQQLVMYEERRLSARHLAAWTLTASICLTPKRSASEVQM